MGVVLPLLCLLVVALTFTTQNPVNNVTSETDISLNDARQIVSNKPAFMLLKLFEFLNQNGNVDKFQGASCKLSKTDYKKFMKSHQAAVMKVRQKSRGEPDNYNGDIVADWYDSVEKKGSAAELGTYYQGDILSSPPTRQRKRKSFLWPRKTIPITFSNITFSPFDVDQLGLALLDIIQKTCIRFVVYKPSKHKDYIKLENKPVGCYSDIGRRGKMQTINLQTPGCTVKRGTIIHEFLHALGLAHEHNRPDRDNYLTIIPENIFDNGLQNFDIFRNRNNFSSPYDYDSIMHFSSTFSSVTDKLDVMLPTDFTYRGTIGEATEMSKKDADLVNTMYKC